MTTVRTRSDIPLAKSSDFLDNLALLQLAEKINLLLAGRGNFVGEVTLAANSATTTIEDRQFGRFAVPVLIPTTANAAAALSGLYVSGRDAGSFELTHANNAQTDRTYLYVRQG